MTRPRDRAPKGQHLFVHVPHGHWNTTTFLAALRTTGIPAPLTMDGASTGDIFLGWVKSYLVYTLKPGDIVVMDNLRVHKVAGLCKAIAAVGARGLYLSPCSPDINPIELAFSKLPWLLKSAACRTMDALWKACGDKLDVFTEQECRNFFKPAATATRNADVL
jgi:transposase